MNQDDRSWKTRQGCTDRLIEPGGPGLKMVHILPKSLFGMIRIRFFYLACLKVRKKIKEAARLIVRLDAN